MEQTSLSGNSNRRAAGPQIDRLRLEPIRRTLTVESTESLTPHMRRIEFTGDDLAGFNSPSPDDHIKLFFQTGDGVAMRDYTPRRFDADKQLLTIDFFLHDNGVGSCWAQQAKPGDPLQIGGPRGSSVISVPGAWWLLIGDETALPSVGRRLEELVPGTPVIGLFAVESAEEEQRFQTQAAFEALWLHRPSAQAGDAAPFIERLAGLRLPSGPGFVWIATEAEVARCIRTFLVDALGHTPEWIKASAYWRLREDEVGG